MICRQKWTHLKPGSPPALLPEPQPPPKRRRTPQNPWGMPRILQREEILADLIQIDIPGYQNFVRMPPVFFYLMEECIHHCIKKEVISFRKPLELQLKLAITLRHLATGETYTSLQYHWLVCRTTICKFVPVVSQAILAEFQEEYLTCPTDPED